MAESCERAEVARVKLGLSIGYWGAGPPADARDMVAAAERLGFDSMWTAEAYGSDALTPLAWWGAATSRIRLGTSIMQLSARTPTAAAMAAMTLDHLSGGRFILGLGASGPQVVEGWYGQPYPKPLARTREYVSIVRDVIARQGPVRHEGEHYQLPFGGGAGLGKPLRSTIHPYREDLPVFLAAEGPKNVAMAAEIADGWLPLWFSPRDDARYRAQLAEGFARPGARRGAEDFEVACPMPVSIDDDVETAADRIRPALALYIGGMGAKGANFHYDVFARMGWESECEKIQELYLSGKKAEAIRAVPLELVEDVAWVGPVAKLREELPRWEASCLTTALVSGPPPVLEQLAGLMS
jgi:F420-dependent oxidoreductase-like protein